jgi:hypothetical protein
MADPVVAQGYRDAATAELPLDADTQEQAALFKACLATIQHFFGGFERLFQDVADPRHPAFIVYPLPVILATGVLMFLLHLGARRQVKYTLRESGPAIAKFQAMFGTDTCPHGDTLNATYRRLQVAEVQEVVSGTVETLIRNKLFYRYRLLDTYYLVVVDGTGTLTFDERHCPHCLTRTRHGHTLYYHPILEAKLVTQAGLVCSLMTEFIENPGELPDKQDCELKAFYRLAERLKQRFPRLPICLLLDGLFAGGPTFSICDKYHWKYLIVLQEDDLPSVHEEFNALIQLAPENHLRFKPANQYKTVQDFRWVNEIAYVDSQDREHSLDLIECLETKPASTGQLKTTRFKWVTNFNVTQTKVVELSNQGGRLRWKIENEGFNVQKNGGYALEHIYTKQPTAAQVFYLLLQIAHLIFQLFQYGSLFRQAFPAGVGSAKNLAFRLLEAWRNLRLSLPEIQAILNARYRIRLDTS